MDAERMRILEMISEGTISAEQAAQLIAALEETLEKPHRAELLETAAGPRVSKAFLQFDRGEQAERSGHSDPSGSSGNAGSSERSETSERSGDWDHFPEPPLGFKKWGAFWLIPLAAGVVITVFSGMLLSAGLRAEWSGFWMFFCIWIPLFFGILVMLMAWSSRTARWLHVRVNTGQEEWPRRVAVSLPLPLRTSAWVLRYFGHYIPGLDDVPVPIHEAVLALQESLTPDEPLYVHVADRDGERVEVFIG